MIQPAGKEIPGTYTRSSQFIVDTHPLYKSYISRWDYLNSMFEGGYTWFLGKYLEPYYFESQDDYMKRLRETALDNHPKSVIGIYNSFLYRKNPKRSFGSLESDSSLENFLKDADLDGRSFDQFMRDVSTYAMVYGHLWVCVDKPLSNAYTRADELEQGIRPYVTIFTPENVLDWKYERQPSGLYRLSYIKVKEETQADYQVIRTYTPEMVTVYRIEQSKDPVIIQETPNPLGDIPFVPVYAQRGQHRGIGVSTISDIADMTKSIYEEYSEIAQIIRLTNHPTLVKTPGTEVSAGAGAIIQMEEGIDPGLRPYILQPDGASIDSVLNSIRQKIESIDRMASLGGIRSVESRRLSGIGLQTEFQLLNSRLADIALNLEHSEEQIWRLYARLQDTVFDGEIEYPRSFSIQDKANEVTMLKQAKDSNIQDPKIIKILDQMILKAIVDDSDHYEELMEEEMEHPTQTEQTKIPHIQEMIMEGYEDQQILDLHPEISQQDIDSAKQDLLNQNGQV